jgi:hypothetical protein
MPVFIDGRLVEFGHDLVYQASHYWEPGVWDKLDRKYHFTIAMLMQHGNYNARLFDGNKDWTLVYWDDTALVYLRNIAANKYFIGLFGYRILRPNSPSQGYLLAQPQKAVMLELQRSCYYAPQSIGAQNMLAAYIKRVQQGNGAKGNLTR